MHDLEPDGRVHDGPAWARLQRDLFERQAAAIEPFVDHYLGDDYEPFWPPEDHEGLDGVDDVFEGFWNWPLVYAMGGSRTLLTEARRAYEAALDRLGRTPTPYGHPMVVDEYEQCRDWFHQGEGNMLHYHFGLADPNHDRTRERAIRFAGFYLGDGEPENYDPDRRVVRGPMNGSMGPEYCDYALFEHHPYGADYIWERHGLPWRDLEFDSVADLKDPANEERLFEVLNERCSRGDIPLNLGITTLMTDAYLHTGDERYREWVATYVDAWRDRTDRNGGIIPDNVGRSGDIGEYLDGQWYGGKYGWSWGGWHYVGVGTTVGAENRALLSGDTEHMGLLRSQLDVLLDRAIDGADHPDAGPGTYVPHKRGDPGNYEYEGSGLRDENGDVLYRDGWYEFHPHRDNPYAVHLWVVTMADGDRDRVDELGVPDGWRRIRYRPTGKHGGGQEYSWLAYLDGRFAGYPRVLMEAAHERVRRQRTRIEDEAGAIDDLHEDYLRDRNPVHEQALLQLTMGAPQPVYYGGLLTAQCRHFDPERERSGLPRDVAALVTDVRPDGFDLRLVNLGEDPHSVVVQGGAYGEHAITRLETGTERAHIDGRAVALRVPAGRTVTATATLDRYANDPTYAYPWDAGPD